MSQPHIFAVQVLVRVQFTDGVVAGMMMPYAELSPASFAAEKNQAHRLIDLQGKKIREAFGSISLVELHDAAILKQDNGGAGQDEMPLAGETEQVMVTRVDVLRKLTQLVHSNIASGPLDSKENHFTSANSTDGVLTVTMKDANGEQREFRVMVVEQPGTCSTGRCPPRKTQASSADAPAETPAESPPVDTPA